MRHDDTSCLPRPARSVSPGFTSCISWYGMMPRWLRLDTWGEIAMIPGGSGDLRVPPLDSTLLRFAALYIFHPHIGVIEHTHFVFFTSG